MSIMINISLCIHYQLPCESISKHISKNASIISPNSKLCPFNNHHIHLYMRQPGRTESARHQMDSADVSDQEQLVICPVLLLL